MEVKQYTKYTVLCQLSSVGYLLTSTFETLALHFNRDHRHHSMLRKPLLQCILTFEFKYLNDSH